mmetsp:Transcript_14079/g.46686  ORF Transcript_14079/g.46686 Transcript_14079/m.46686 type:complete len:502 (+) Transcript_14079:820-2325(+)
MSPINAKPDLLIPGDLKSVIAFKITSRVPSGSADTKTAAPSATPSAIPESKSSVHTTWSGSYPTSTSGFASCWSRKVKALRESCNARCHIAGAYSCAARPTPMVTDVTHSRSWYKSGWVSPPCSHFCNRGESNAVATAGLFREAPALSAKVATASSAHRKFLRPYEPTASPKVVATGCSHVTMSSLVSCKSVASAPHAADWTCLFLSPTLVNSPAKIFSTNALPCGAVAGSGSPGRGANASCTVHRANLDRVQQAVARNMGRGSSSEGTKNSMSCGRKGVNPASHPSLTAPTAKIADSLKRQSLSLNRCSTIGKIIPRSSSPNTLLITSSPLALLFRKFQLVSSSSSPASKKSSSFSFSAPSAVSSPPKSLFFAPRKLGRTSLSLSSVPELSSSSSAFRTSSSSSAYFMFVRSMGISLGVNSLNTSTVSRSKSASQNAAQNSHDSSATSSSPSLVRSIMYAITARMFGASFSGARYNKDTMPTQTSFRTDPFVSIASANRA